MVPGFSTPGPPALREGEDRGNRKSGLQAWKKCFSRFGQQVQASVSDVIPFAEKP